VRSSIEAHGPDAFISAKHTTYQLPPLQRRHFVLQAADASGGAGRDRPEHDGGIKACGASQQGKDKAQRPSVQLNEDSACPTFLHRLFNLLKHALSKQTIRCTIQTALLWLVPALAMCGVAFALGRAVEQHRWERDIHALSSAIDAGNVIAMREVRVSALTS